MRKRLLFYCQPVLGIGHYIRSRAIVRALSDFDVCFVNGGEIVRGLEMPSEVEVVNLPALKSDAEFQQLQLSKSDFNLDEVKAQRTQQLRATYDRIKPEVVVIELFPFGRRKFDFELLPLLEAIQSPTKVVCSLRDILVSKRQQEQFEQEACTLMNRYFDLLLIHSDPNFQRLEETFPRVPDLTCKVLYTGFVVQSRPLSERKQNDVPTLLVSIGGGRVGHELIDCAIAASGLLTIRHHLHIVTGPHCPNEIFAQLQQRIAQQATISLERFTPDFPALLQQADLSISMAGYNTCMDILSAGVRAILYPFTGNNNQEQTMRARKLEQLGRVRLIQQLDPAQLAEAITQSLQTPVPPVTIDMNGAAATARILSTL
ncbi:MAG: glycosyl transferase [Blastocatellia bacterium]|nr:glycosyl transferase [Blastocatellia bacterium]